MPPFFMLVGLKKWGGQSFINTIKPSEDTYSGKEGSDPTPPCP